MSGFDWQRHFRQCLCKPEVLNSITSTNTPHAESKCHGSLAMSLSVTVIRARLLGCICWHDDIPVFENHVCATAVHEGKVGHLESVAGQTLQDVTSNRQHGFRGLNAASMTMSQCCRQIDYWASTHPPRATSGKCSIARLWHRATSGPIDTFQA